MSPSQAHRHLRGRRATVMGLGLFGGGLETTRYLARIGARVTVTDLRTADQLAESIAELRGLDVELALGGHRERDFVDADLVVVNPAVAPTHPMLERARLAGVALTSELALFLEAVRARVALITGTQGKSSTASMTAALLAACGVRAELGGNIGRSLLCALDALDADDVAVVEVSSYQLEALPTRWSRAPRVAAVCVTNVLADHLERHGSLDAYEAAKRRILELAGPETVAVLNGEDPRVARWDPSGVRVERFFATRAVDDGLYIADGCFWRGTTVLGRVAELVVPGAYQRENALAALGVASALGAAPERLADAIAGLRGLEHREQDLGLRGGRRVWDNGVSTTPDSTVAAIKSLARPLVVMLGGQKKDLPLDGMLDELATRRLRVVTFGAASVELAAACTARTIEVARAASLEDAVLAAYRIARDEDEILFSPACASFDRYRNFKDRAIAFRAALPATDELRPPALDAETGRNAAGDARPIAAGLECRREPVDGL